jgi:hypothetical protein
MRRRLARVSAPGSCFAGFRSPPEVITMGLRWYLRSRGTAWLDCARMLLCRVKPVR